LEWKTPVRAVAAVVLVVVVVALLGEALSSVPPMMEPAGWP
jgi:hypothetical protein